jgi:hypothetical protein
LAKDGTGCISGPLLICTIIRNSGNSFFIPAREITQRPDLGAVVTRRAAGQSQAAADEVILDVHDDQTRHGRKYLTKCIGCVKQKAFETVTQNVLEVADKMCQKNEPKCIESYRQNVSKE